jgi:DNA-binding transcriptional ArsR family regulator
VDALEAIADPTRRRILELLKNGEVAAGDLCGEFTISRPAVSRHLRVLREVGLVQSRVDGQRRVYALDARPLAELDAWLEPYRRFWAQRLEALDTELRRGRRRRRRT